VLRAVQVILDEELAVPTLIGRPAIIEKRIERFGLRMRPGVDITIVNPEFDPRYRDFWETYHRITARKGVSTQYAQVEMRRRHTLIGAMLIKKRFCGWHDLWHLWHHCTTFALHRSSHWAPHKC